MTHRRTWQKLESAVAALMGGKRRTGTYQAGEDVIHGRFAIECKLRAKLGFIPWFNQVAGYAVGGKIPLLVCRQKGSGDMYAVLKLADLIEILPPEYLEP